MSEENIQDASDEIKDPAESDVSKDNPEETKKAAEPAAPANDTNQVLVNSQIVDAVKQTRDAVRIGSSDTSKVIDSGIAYQKASQAAAFAVQDATDYLRNIMAISSTAQGMALKLFLETKDPLYSQVLTQAQTAVTMAATNLETVGMSAISVATDFPR